MKLKLALAVGILVAAAAAGAAVLFTHGQSPHAAIEPSTHGTGIDHSEAAALASLRAPEGKTPCETAFNAITASQEAAKAQGTPPLFKWVAGREQFLAGCEALPKETQACMAPRYMAQHREDCVRRRPTDETLKQLFVAAPRVP